MGIPRVSNADSHDPAHVARFYDRAAGELLSMT